MCPLTSNMVFRFGFGPTLIEYTDWEVVAEKASLCQYPPSAPAQNTPRTPLEHPTDPSLEQPPPSPNPHQFAKDKVTNCDMAARKW